MCLLGIDHYRLGEIELAKDLHRRGSIVNHLYSLTLPRGSIDV